MSRPGSRSAAAFGIKVLTGSTTTWPTCKKRKNMTEKNKGAVPRELTLTRILDAPRELVFKLWTEPRHLAQWWGPHGFTNPVCELDARAGGAIRVHMRAPDGTAYPMGGAFEEIVPPQRLVFTTSAHAGGETGAFFVNRNTVTFDDLDGRT